MSILSNNYNNYHQESTEKNLSPNPNSNEYYRTGRIRTNLPKNMVERSNFRQYGVQNDHQPQNHNTIHQQSFNTHSAKNAQIHFNKKSQPSNYPKGLSNKQYKVYKPHISKKNHEDYLHKKRHYGDVQDSNLEKVEVYSSRTMENMFNSMN